MTEIKPCPFCRGRGVRVKRVYGPISMNKPAQLICAEIHHRCVNLSDDEFVTVLFKIRGRSEQDVIAAWNTRADATVAKAVERERDRCVAIVEAFKQANDDLLEGSEIGAHRSRAIQGVLDAVSDAIRGDSK